MFKKILGAMAVSVMVLISNTSADFLPVRAYGNDTVAGYAATLKSSLLTSGQKVVFVVERPDGGVVRVPAEAGPDGVAQAELYGHQTKTAGAYKVALVYPGSSGASPQSTFNVYAGPVSSTQSLVTTVNSLVRADGSEKTFVTVLLYDAYRNPVSGHAVKLISSRSEDRIETLNGGVTDAAGRADFKVTSLYPGISVFTALDSTLNQILADREEVVFQEALPLEKGSAIGGNLLRANLLDAGVGQDSAAVSGPVDHFQIEGLPSRVQVNEELSFIVEAKDKNGNTAKNYTGTMLFAVSGDENAVLPGNGEYTFKEKDQGRFTFNLALRFSTLGRQTLQVFDKDNWSVAGEQETEVVSSAAPFVPAAVSGRLSIKSPLDGSELGSNLVVISGQADPYINLRVFDNDVKIGDSETDSDGFFNFEARGLLSGAHTFYVMSEKDEVSNSVSIRIDTLPPVLNSLQVFPEGVAAPGEKLTVIAASEPNLETVSVRIQGALQTLTPGSDPGTYEGSVTAPAVSGTFPLDVILTDKLANKAELLNQRSVRVEPALPSLPPQVTGLTGQSADGAVTLSWTAVTGHASPITHYRIDWGTHFQNLDQTTDTAGPVTSFTLKPLVNNTQYFFAVKAVDSKGMESELKSEVIGVTPVAPAFPAPVTAPADGYAATPMNGAVHLTWPAISGAFYYKVYFGLVSGRYDDFSVTPGNATSVTIKDLINDLPYYFSVAALDLSGKEISSLSPEWSTVPGIALHGSAVPVSYGTQLGRVPQTQKTGPEAWGIAAIALVFAHFFYGYKRRFFKR